MSFRNNSTSFEINNESRKQWDTWPDEPSRPNPNNTTNVYLNECPICGGHISDMARKSKYDQCPACVGYDAADVRPDRHMPRMSCPDCRSHTHPPWIKTEAGIKCPTCLGIEIMIRRREMGHIHGRAPKPFYDYYKMSDDDPIDISYAAAESVKTNHEYAAAQRHAIDAYKRRLERERIRAIEYENAVDRQQGVRKFRKYTRGW